MNNRIIILVLIPFFINLFVYKDFVYAQEKSLRAYMFKVLTIENCIPDYEIAVDDADIWLEPNNISLYINELRSITAVIVPPFYENKDVLWQSNNPQVVQIVATGEVDENNNPKTNIATLSPGVAIITATMVATDQSAKARVEVVLNQVQSVTIEPEQVTLMPFESIFLRAFVSPKEGTNPMVSFESTSPGVASVDEIGLVVAKQAGETRIIARSVQDDSISAYSVIRVLGEGSVPVEDGMDPILDVEEEIIDDQQESASHTGTELNNIFSRLIIGLIMAAAFIAGIVFSLSKRKSRLFLSNISTASEDKFSKIQSGPIIPNGSGTFESIGAGIIGVKGQFSGQTLKFEDAKLVIGRDKRIANVVYPDSKSIISRKHLTITYDSKNNKYLLIDSSSNGTFLSNHHQLESGKPYYLSPGEQFYLVEPHELFELKYV